VASMRSVVGAIHVSLTGGSLSSFPSRPFDMVRWMSETMVRMLVTSCSISEVMVQAFAMSRQMSEMVPYVLLAGGASDSPGALDANFRYQVLLWSRPLT